MAVRFAHNGMSLFVTRKPREYSALFENQCYIQDTAAKLMRGKNRCQTPVVEHSSLRGMLSAVQDYKTQLLAQRIKLKELFNSALRKSMQIVISTVK